MVDPKILKKDGTGSEPVCFVVMPISDAEPYSTGHFRRVYDFIIKPACSLAGFIPVRADDVNQTNHIVLDVLRQLIDADMTLCDLSGRNPNVLYELGIRQAFNRPVCLIKDAATPRIFDIQGLRDIEYDESLRVDMISSTVSQIADSLKKTRAAHGRSEHVNSLVQLLGVSAAPLPQASELSAEGSLVLSALADIAGRLTAIEESFPGKRQMSAELEEALEYLGGNAIDSSKEPRPTMNPVIVLGMHLRHRKFGEGVVVGMSGKGRDEIATVHFEDPAVGRKRLVVAQANLEVLPDR